MFNGTDFILTRPELSTMTNQELILWVVINAPIREENIRHIFPDLESFCAKHTIGLPSFIEEIYDLTSNGVNFSKAVETIKERALS